MSESFWLDWSEKDWAIWLAQKLLNRQKSYELVPEDLLANYNREKGHTRDYHGRELLELIQNADDAAFNFSGDSKLFIKLTSSALYIANTGITFSDEGITSLMVSDISPKQAKGMKCIGYKGLGFRSILGWTSSIFILSGNAKIGFSQRIANKWLEKIKSNSNKISEIVDKYNEKTGVVSPIAILSAPYFIDEKISDKNINNHLGEGEKLIKQGYDTVICLVFSSPKKIIPEIETQINAIQSEILLFLQHIKELSIDSLGKLDHWDVEREKDVIMVTTRDSESHIWNITNDEGVIPNRYLSSEQKKLSNKYEMKIAIPAQPTDSLDFLYVYFPTNEQFPFPISVHATFEVTGNRQNLTNSKANEYISGKLASLMAKSARSIVNKNDLWIALVSFLPYSDISQNLNKFKFYEALIENLKREKIVPSIDGKFISAKNAKRLNGDFSSILPKKHFNNICLHTEDSYLYERLEIPFLDYDEFINNINKISKDLSLNDRAELIYLIVDNYPNQNSDVVPTLLVDSNNLIIPGNVNAILPPEGIKFTLPEWVPLKIINSNLLELLKDKFELENVRDLRRELNRFKVQEYNLTSVVQAIVAEANRKIKATSDKKIRKEMVKALWEVYSSLGTEVHFQERITIPLPSRSGEDTPADELYFGQEYNKGKLLEYLYGNIDTVSFVASPKDLGFDKIFDEFESFLSWLGVTDRPIYLREGVMDSNYKEYVVSQLETPAKFAEFPITNPSNESWRINGKINNVQKVDHLEEVLKKADPHAIISWIALDSNLEICRISGDSEAKLLYDPGGRYNLRQLQGQSIYSYPIWLLNTMEWIPTISGITKSPNTCSISRKAKDLSPIIGFPNINYEHPLFNELGLDKSSIQSALVKIGVVYDLDELPWDSFYELLLNIPKIDPEGEMVKPLYRTLISRTDIEEYPPDGEKYKRFLQEGKMYGGSKIDKKYYPIKKLYYVENNIIPDHIVEHYPLVEIDRRRGAKKVSNLFGIEQLTIDKLKIRITKTITHFLNDRFQDELKRIKPYIYAIRVQEDSNNTELSTLKSLEIILCEKVDGTIIVDENPIEITIKSYKSIPDNKDKNKVFLVTDIEERIENDISSKILNNELMASSIGEIITNLFKIDISSDIARLVSCSNENRDELLNQIVGGAGKERLIKACELFESNIDEDEYLPYVQPISQGLTNTEENEEPSLEDEEPENDEINNEFPEDDVGSVNTTEINFEPTEAKEIEGRVTSNERPPRTRKPSKLANPIRAENLSMRFEESQNRYPLKVSHLQGSKRYGCDILSFSTENNRTLFEENNDLSIVDRFIEVKGSTHKTGTINLGGNELKRARESQSKYYLYRVYEDIQGKFELIELCDPLDESSPKWQFIVNPFRSNRTKSYNVTESKVSTKSE